MARKVRTMGDLRGVFLDMIDGVQSGRIDAGHAAVVVKIAAQVNNSLLAEIEVNRFAIQQKRPEEPLGHLVLAPLSGEPDPAAEPATFGVKPPQLAPNMARIIDRRPNGEKHDFGDPPPGRSALDQRARAIS